MADDSMIFHLTQFYIKRLRPVLLGRVTRIIYSGKRVRFGTRFRTDSIPRIIVDKNCRIEIGDNVEFRRNIELRCHGSSFISIENSCRIDRGVRILSANKSSITIGEQTRIGLYVVLNGGDHIKIGRNVLISGFVYLQTSMHQHHAGKNIQDQGYSHAAITLEDDVWIGTHVVVLPGCKLGKGTIAGSNAVITKSFEQDSVIAGVPARMINQRT